MEDLLAIARRLADALEREEIPYALGGAVACSYWGVARGTHDLDINLFVEEPGFAAAFEVLAREGLGFDREEALKSATERGDLRADAAGMRVDVFVNSIPLHRSAAGRVRREMLLGRPVSVLAAEDIAVLKMLFLRPKDVLDVERILAVQGGALDRGYVRGWLVDSVGEDDERVRRWDELARSLPP
jgi:hypothetical protein